MEWGSKAWAETNLRWEVSSGMKREDCLCAFAGDKSPRKFHFDVFSSIAWHLCRELFEKVRSLKRIKKMFYSCSEE